MRSPFAVCYVATDGYLFQTIVSAMQARQRLQGDGDVFVVHLGADSPERTAFARLCAELDVVLLGVPRAALGPLHVTYGRFLLGAVLPEHVHHVLYVDGDTQITDDLAPLLHAQPSGDRLFAVRDPMVLLHEASPRFRGLIDAWWDDGGIRRDARARYVNSGVLRIERDGLRRLHAAALRVLNRPFRETRFLDQDFLNREAGSAIDLVSMRWNFPAFLLASPLAEVVKPAVIHFMSDPRPWEAPFWPWGHEHHRPYRELVRSFPEIGRYWRRAGVAGRARYRLQQRYKRATEGRLWRSPRLLATLEQFESGTRTLP